jgi:hypothetical protein
MNTLPKTLKVCISLILICIALMTISFFPAESDMDQGLSDESKILYNFLNHTGKILATKYQMTEIGSGLGGMNKVDLMTLSFDRQGNPLQEHEARKLIIQCVEIFLQAINGEDQLRPYLQDYPFTAKNLDVSIFNSDENQVWHYFPHIAIVANTKGKVCFLTKSPSAQYGYHTEKYETYEEAVAILAAENKADKLTK